jgi:hypothetical protein
MWQGKGWLLALLITAVGFALRVGGVTEFWLNGDEGIYDHIAHAPPDLAKRMIALNAHPPLQYLLLRGIALVSDDFVWLRVPSLLFGSLSIFAMYLLGREVGGAVCGVAAALAAALSPGAIVLSQLARPYALQGLLIVSALLFFFRYLRGRRARDLTLYVACMLVALFVQYGSVLPLAGMMLVLAACILTRRFDARALRGLALAHLPLLLAGALLYALHVGPSLSGSGVQTDAVGGWLASQFVAGPGEIWRNFLGLFDYAAGTRLAAAAAVAFLAGIAACIADRRYALVGLCAAVLIAAVCLSLLSLYPFGGTRHSFHLAPLLGLTIAYAVGWVARRGFASAAVAAGVAGLLVLGAGPTEAVLGFPVDREGPPPELTIARSELDELTPVIEALARSPGILIVDHETLSTLSPFFREARVKRRMTGKPPIMSFPWGARRVLIHPAWNMDAGVEDEPSGSHLALLLQLAATNPKMARLIDRDMRVISTGGPTIPQAIRALSRPPGSRPPLLDELSQTPHVSVFRLNVALYRHALRAAGRTGG